MKNKIILIGATGLVGQILREQLPQFSYVVVSRKHHIDKDNTSYVKWNGTYHPYWGRELEDSLAVINLNGKSVDCRYSTKNKEEIYDSRLQSTYAVGKAISNCKNPPKVWLNASTATIYRDSYKPNTEKSTNIGGDFSMDVAQKWEQEFFRSPTPNTRKIALRMAIILSKKGGAYVPLQKMIKAGMGGKQGSGKQLVSWISEEDIAFSILHLLQNDSSKGVYNLSAPNPLPNKEFMKTLRTINSVPFGLPMPKFLLQLGAKIIGTEEELILKSRFVLPEKLLKEGYRFQHPKLTDWTSN